MQAQRVRPRFYFTRLAVADPGVESELYGAVPRRVESTAHSHKARIRFANVVAGLLLIAYYMQRSSGPGVDPVAWLFVGVAAMVIAAWLGAESRVRRSRHFLQTGYAAKATVVNFETSDNSTVVNFETSSSSIGYVDVRYVYATMAGESATGYLVLPFEDATRVGGFAVGTTFTVLLNPTERYDVLPYFQVYGVEIPGAAPVRTMPPVGSI
ncbi:MAG: hypothetical protein H7145_03780 [Akkermansiaceae bacterium]|nr:hypothetical protein [Armatimonadota bacterium]